MWVPHESPKEEWVSRFPVGESTKGSLRRLIGQDHDPSEESYYEAAADPQLDAIEREQRRYREMLRRRLRHVRTAKRY